jgi:hypothetical protein
MYKFIEIETAKPTANNLNKKEEIPIQEVIYA